jgi:hypothetical protein
MNPDSDPEPPLPKIEKITDEKKTFFFGESAIYVLLDFKVGNENWNPC